MYFNEYFVTLTLPCRQLNEVLKDIRLEFGRGAVEPNVRKELVEGKLTFDKYFTATTTYFWDNEHDLIERPFVYCSDIQGLLCHLGHLRDQDPTDLALKIGIDNGQGHLQVKNLDGNLFMRLICCCSVVVVWLWGLGVVVLCCCVHSLCPDGSNPLRRGECPWS